MINVPLSDLIGQALPPTVTFVESSSLKPNPFMEMSRPPPLPIRVGVTSVRLPVTCAYMVKYEFFCLLIFTFH